MRSSIIPTSACYLVALTAGFLPAICARSTHPDLAVYTSFGLSVLWVGAMLYGFKHGDEQMPRKMLGFPLVLFWPMIGLLAEISCRFGHDCL